MEFFEVLRRRRSIREFTDEVVDDDALESLVDDAVQAPSAMNRQPWSFVIITDRELIDRYDAETKAAYLDHATAPLQDVPEELLEHLRGVIDAPGYRIFHGAPAVILLLAPADDPGAAGDCFLAAENLMLAACARGLGTCPIGLALPVLNRSDVKTELGIRPSLRVVLPIIVGVPAHHVPPVPRKPPEVIRR